MNRNYQKELDRIIQKRGKTLPRVLLHGCCAPCSSSVLEYLSEYFDVTLLWYNPNIYPQEEFDRRFQALVKLIEDMGLAGRVQILAEPWKREDYYKRVQGLEQEPEGGRRCTECFRLRLMETAKLAKMTGVAWLPSDFKKRDRENRSIALCEQYGVYRQLYCGCEFSLRHRQTVAEEKAAENKE